MMKKICARSLIGFPLGISYGLFFSLIFSYLYKLDNYIPAPPNFIESFQRPLNAMLVSVIIWGLIGVVFSSTSIIFTDTDWSITKMTILHFILSYVLFVPLSILACWYPLSLKGILIFTIYYAIIYVIIWFLAMAKAKNDLKQINKKL